METYGQKRMRSIMKRSVCRNDRVPFRSYSQAIECVCRLVYEIIYPSVNEISIEKNGSVEMICKREVESGKCRNLAGKLIGSDGVAIRYHLPDGDAELKFSRNCRDRPVFEIRDHTEGNEIKHVLNLMDDMLEEERSEDNSQRQVKFCLDERTIRIGNLILHQGMTLDDLKEKEDKENIRIYTSEDAVYIHFDTEMEREGESFQLELAFGRDKRLKNAVFRPVNHYSDFEHMKKLIDCIMGRKGEEVRMQNRIFYINDSDWSMAVNDLTDDDMMLYFAYDIAEFLD